MAEGLCDPFEQSLPHFPYAGPKSYSLDKSA